VSITGENIGVYDESKVKTLSSIEHIRLRTGMYIGRLGDGSSMDDGIYVLLKEVVDNSVDEFIMGCGSRIKVRLEEGTVTWDWAESPGSGVVRANQHRPVQHRRVSHWGQRWNQAVNPLHRSVSPPTEIPTFSPGVSGRHPRLYEKTNPGSRRPNLGYRFQPEFIERRMQHYAFLNSGLRVQFNDRVFRSDDGLRDLLNDETGDEAIYDAVYYRNTTLEFAFTHTNSYGEKYFSFANGQYTSAGGSHLSAFKEGVLKGVNAYSGKGFTAEDVRDGLVAAVSVRLKDPVFESQTKNRLGNTDIPHEPSIRIDNPSPTPCHRSCKIQANQKLRTELQTVKKKARERAKQTAIRIPNLKDCKVHLGDGHEREEESTIFLTEGLSAAGSLVSSRDVHTQAVFALRGKPQNVFGLKRDAVYSNKEIYNIMRALNIEGGVEGLRYNRVVLATDADVDGMHIRNLLMTLSALLQPALDATCTF
jgi:topoisomerase-4 subunit B